MRWFQILSMQQQHNVTRDIFIRSTFKTKFKVMDDFTEVWQQNVEICRYLTACQNGITTIEDIHFNLCKGPTSSANMANENLYMTSYFMEIVLFAILLTISEIFAFEVHRSNANMPVESPYCDFLFDDNGNVCAFCYHFWNIHSRNVQVVEVDL